MIELKVEWQDSDQRLDRWLRKKFPGESLSKIFGVLRKKKVRLNGKVAKGPERLNINDLVQIYEHMTEAGPESEQPLTVNENFFRDHFHIIDETPDLIVVNKPAGLAAHPGSLVRPGESLVELAWHYCRSEQAAYKPQLVHRLDKETSGLVLIAKHPHSLRHYNDVLKTRRITKIYLAAVWGKPPHNSGTISAALNTETKAAERKVTVNDEDGVQAVSHYRYINGNGLYSLLEVRLETGRTHQIRVHLNSIGCPIIGDTRYGNFDVNKSVKREYGFKRMFLHAHHLNIDNGTSTGEQWKAPLPEENQAFLIKAGLPVETQ